MKRLQVLLVAIGVAAISILLTRPVLATISTLQDQIGITIVVNVAASPIGYLPHQSPAGGNQSVITAVSLHRIAPSLARGFQAEGLHFERNGSVVIAQAQVQHSTLVQAEVTPNPKATLLYSNQGSVIIPAAPGSTVIAGTTAVETCAFTVTVDTTKSWSLDEGLTSDFAAGFSGTALANNTYLNSATPLPTSTPYVVYADDSSKWSLAGTGTAMKTYCVDLTVKVPGTVTAGSYSTNAVYSLYF